MITKADLFGFNVAQPMEESFTGLAGCSPGLRETVFLIHRKALFFLTSERSGLGTVLR